MLPTALAWATLAVALSLLTPPGFFGFFIVPVWLLVVGALLYRGNGTMQTVR